ncbi:MAG: SAM-dependent methyltransferase, partial [bacterium]|nr:SAM-dependent methyltransferase [bacterium]
GLQGRPKLVLPDMKAAAHPVLDDGQFYPHHNLYYVVSDAWDLEVLGGLLLSDIANLFVGSYCVKMRGGCYRFQAQYLRRIRVPSHDSLNARSRRALARAFANRDVEAATATAAKLYGLSHLAEGIPA